MPKLKSLSGPDVVKIFIDLGFIVVSQKGSHIKLRRILPNKMRQILTIPNHKELDKETVKAIYRQALRYISESELYPHFYIS